MTVSPLRLRKLLRNPSLLLGVLITLTVMGVALVGHLYTPFAPNAMEIANRTQSPDLTHPFGTDDFGRDILSRVMAGASTALTIGIVSVAFGLFLGVSIGFIAAHRLGWVDEVLMRIMDGTFAFPPLLFAVTIVAITGQGVLNTALAIGLINVPIFARIARGGFLSAKEQDFVEGARALGAPTSVIVLVHILPNIMAPIIVQATVSLATAILAEASLSYLGLGTQPPDPSWGRMLKESQSFFSRAPWMSIFPGLAIALTVLGFNLLGDGLRDWLDPRS